jgi:RNA polymerase sigma factor (sigma-70 family)
VTAEEERNLTRRAKAGDPAALQALLAAHRGMLWQFARRWGRKIDGFDLDDAFQEVQIAAIEALETYDPESGYRFLTYAGRKIVWTLKRLWQRQGTISIPGGGNLRAPHLREKARQARKIGAIDQAFGMADPHGEIQPVERAIAAEEKRHLRRALDRLPARERLVVLNRIVAGEKLEPIGRRIGVSKERVRQLQTKALKELKRHCAALVSAA